MHVILSLAPACILHVVAASLHDADVQSAWHRFYQMFQLQTLFLLQCQQSLTHCEPPDITVYCLANGA